MVSVQRSGWHISGIILYLGGANQVTPLWYIFNLRTHYFPQKQFSITSQKNVLW